MAANVSLIERSDVHKSCKALETVVNLFNDYCQASDTLAAIQKKLARALKEASTLKATNELAGNTLNVAATLIEVLADVQAKFVKLADKECESTSSDLKKWFKRLAKEEKSHDERINAANAKIKQAGQAYEKKAKKKDADAADEHTRYVNILSVVGPEMSQEKYNHSLLISQKHSVALYGVTASISRTVDAEWLRACECVRRISPVIGRLGECRAYLEGQWMGSIPTDAYSEGKDKVQNLLEPTKQVDELGVRLPRESTSTSTTSPDISNSRSTPLLTTASLSSSPPSSTTSLRSPQSSSAPPTTSNRTHPPLAPPTSFYPGYSEKTNVDSVRSIESLSNFPTPPTHFPLPYIPQLSSSPLAQNSSSEQTTSNPEKSRVVKKMSDNNFALNDSGTSPVQTPTSNIEPWHSLAVPLGRSTPNLTDDSGSSPLIEQKDPQTPLSTGANKIDTSDVGKVCIVKDSSTSSENPLSVDRQKDLSGPCTSDTVKQERKVSRTESVVSTSSIVASMRDKWGRGDIPSTTSTRERDAPRVTTKVADLASRYSVTDKTLPPSSPRTTGESFPNTERPRQFSAQSHENSNDILNNNNHLSNTQNNQNTPTTSSRNSRNSWTGTPSNDETSASTASELNFARRKKRLEELEDIERREVAQALRARERDLVMRAKELEMERERLRSMAAASMSPRTSMNEPQDMQTGVTRAQNAASIRGHAQHSYSMTNLNQTSERNRGDGLALTRPMTQYGEPLSATPMSFSPSTTSSASENQPRQLTNLKEKDKAKGWIRRLSMPVSAVGNAFSHSDSKKAGIVASGYGSPYGFGAGIASDHESSTKQVPFERDSTGGISNVVSRPRKLSFGRR